jgi:hypothetical protein
MATTPESERLTSSEFTQQTMLSDLTHQRWLIGIGIALGAMILFRLFRRPPEHEEAARRLVRDWRKVDDVYDARDLLGKNVPAVLRPALLLILQEIERQVHRGIRRLERTIEHL